MAHFIEKVFSHRNEIEQVVFRSACILAAGLLIMNALLWGGAHSVQINMLMP